MKKKTNDCKMFVVRTYVMAKNVSHAIKLTKGKVPDEVFVDSDWKEDRNKQLASAIGFDNGHEAY